MTLGELFAVVTILIIFGAAYISHRKEEKKRKISNSRNYAEMISSREWYVKQITVYLRDEELCLDDSGWSTSRASLLPNFREGTASIDVVPYGSDRRPTQILFEPKHPNIDEVQRWQYLERLKFNFTQNPLSELSPENASAYLTLA